MNLPVEINGKIFVPVKQAAADFDYSRDHITRLAKAKKITATQLGRLWFVDSQSLKNYFVDQQTEAEIRKNLLSKKRQSELRTRTLLSDAGTQTDAHEKNSGKFAVMCACLLFGLLLVSASQIVPASAVSVASVESSSRVVSASSPEQTTTIRPVFSVDGGVVVTDASRQVEKPEVTSQWVQVIP